MRRPTHVAAITALKFPFELKNDQVEAVNAWIAKECRGSVIYSTGTGKTEIAFECARKAALLHKEQGFKILFLVPRIVLIEQNVKRLLNYGVPSESIGVFFGEKKEIREIIISTYQSIINNYDLIRNSDMIILDEIHLISETATEFDKIFDVIVEDPRKCILGLTATLDERDPKYSTILVVAPPVKKYMIKDAVMDGRLAKPEIIARRVKLNPEEQKIYDESTEKIREISRKLQAHDAEAISRILVRGGHRAFLAKSWFANVRKRKNLLSSTDKKLREAIDIVKSHPNQRIMIFSETIDSIEQLKNMLISEGIPAMTIHNEIKKKERKEILDTWGKKYFPLLSVHTLEIGYDVPQVGIAIIIASTTNMNQVAQRIGRVIRKSDEKINALIYVVYVDETKDDRMLKTFKAAVEKKASPVSRDNLDGGRQASLSEL